MACASCRADAVAHIGNDDDQHEKAIRPGSAEQPALPGPLASVKVQAASAGGARPLGRRPTGQKAQSRLSSNVRCDEAANTSREPQLHASDALSSSSPRAASLAEWLCFPNGHQGPHVSLSPFAERDRRDVSDAGLYLMFPVAGGCEVWYGVHNT